MTSLQETFRIGREARIAVEIFHLKVTGQAQWGHADRVIRAIETAREQGPKRRRRHLRLHCLGEHLFRFYSSLWRHDGGNAELIRRLKDPASRKRIREDMSTPSTQWDNECTAGN